jgi:hypothetical protein
MNILKGFNRVFSIIHLDFKYLSYKLILVININNIVITISKIF